MSANARSDGVWRWLERAAVAAAMAVTVWFYHWTVAANDGFEDWGDIDYFRLMVRGWNKGQLHLDTVPRPELLALADPYDPAQNEGLKLGDASLYKGKYYIYFGPVPALTLMWPWGAITGQEMKMGEAALVFAVLAFGAASALWLAVRRRYFPESAWCTAPLGVLALGFGTHLLAVAQRPLIWELPIAAGVAWTTLAVLCAYAAIHGRRPLLAMAGAGLCLGLAVGSRPSCLLAAPVLLAPLWLAWRRPQAGREWWRLGLAAAGPLAACGLALMAYNYARFENPLEFGQRYQLSGAYEGKLVHFSLRFLLHNLSVYFFQPLLWSGDFPYAQAQGIEITHIKDYFGTEEVAGLLVTLPFFWFALALPLVWWRRAADERAGLAATLAAVAGYAVPVTLVINCYFSTCARYQTDFAVILGVVALTGLLGLERWAQARTAWRWTIRGVAAGAIAATLVLGALMAFDYHSRLLRRTSPEIWAKLDRGTHEWVRRIGGVLAEPTGPRVLKVRFQARPAGTVETFWQASDGRADERVLVGHIGEQLIRFGYRRGSDPVRWGVPLKWKSGHTHTVEVQVPSLYGPARDGWWGRVQGRLAFRERTAVAVWFSGGRALSTIAEPWAPDIRPGGAVGTDFSGEVRKLYPRWFRFDEVQTGWFAEPHAPRGGTLRMEVWPAPGMDELGEPLFAVGAHYRSTIVVMREVEGGYRFNYDNYGVSITQSELVPKKAGGYVVELELPNFRPEKYGVEHTGDVVIRVDGREVLRTRQVAFEFPWGAESIASNPFGTTCGPEFRGWVREVRFVRPAAPPTQ